MRQEMEYDNPSSENWTSIKEILGWTWEIKKYIQMNKNERLKMET